MRIETFELAGQGDALLARLRRLVLLANLGYCTSFLQWRHLDWVAGVMTATCLLYQTCFSNLQNSRSFKPYSGSTTTTTQNA